MLNKIMVIGHLGTDPDMRYTPSGKPVTQFRLATSRNFNAPDGQRQKETEWFTIVAWDKLGELCNQFLSKGRRAYVEGRFRSRQWTGQDGQTRNVNEIVAERVLFLDRPAEAAEAPAGREEAGAGQVGPDDLPF